MCAMSHVEGLVVEQAGGLGYSWVVGREGWNMAAATWLPSCLVCCKNLDTIAAAR